MSADAKVPWETMDQVLPSAKRVFPLMRSDSNYSTAYPVDMEGVDFRAEALKATRDEERKTRVRNMLSADRAARATQKATVVPRVIRTPPPAARPGVAPYAPVKVVPRGNLPVMFNLTKKAGLLGRSLRKKHTKKQIKRKGSRKQNKRARA
jgi:hypothetical protein